jgi:hypothetical protein
VLRASRKALRPGGWTAFSLIHPAPSLPKAEHRRALRVGPPAVSLGGRTIGELTDGAGFTAVEHHDLTPAYRETLLAKLEAERTVAEELRSTWGDDVVDELVADRRATLAAIDDGLLLRSLVVARAPDR